MHAPIDSRRQRDRPLGEAALAALGREAAKWGVALKTPAWDSASFEIQIDPYSREQTLQARWPEGPAGLVHVGADGLVGEGL